MREFKIVTDRFTPRQTKSTGYYFNDLSSSKPLTPEEEYEVAEKAFNGDKEARDTLVKANLRFVISVAKAYNSSDSELFQDLISVGNIGLLKAAEKFDPSRGFKFISYAVWYIRQEILTYLGNNTRTVRIPLSRLAPLRNAKKIRERLSSELYREPATFEIIDEIKREIERGSNNYNNLSLEDLEYLLEADTKAKSFDAPLSSTEGSSTLLEATENKDNLDFSDDIILSGRNPIVDELLASLNSSEYEIVTRLHGIGDEYGIQDTLDTLGDDFGISTDAVRVRYNKALRRMKSKARNMRINGLDNF